MTQLWKPVTLAASGTMNNGSGDVTQATYTVPSGKRAILFHTYTEIAANANAADTTFIYILALGVKVHQSNGSGIAANAASTLYHYIDLLSGNTVVIHTINSGANNVAYGANAIVREYL